MAGVGNVLRGDDGFGVEVAHRLMKMDWPPQVRVVETGIGGIHLVQEMLAGFDAIIVIDAVDHGRPPGTVMVISPEVLDVYEIPEMERYDLLADMHYTKPEKALMLAKALKLLPGEGKLIMVGCQPEDAEVYDRGFSEPVARAVDVAVAEVRRIVGEMLAAPSEESVGG